MGKKSVFLNISQSKLLKTQFYTLVQVSNYWDPVKYRYRYVNGNRQREKYLLFVVRLVAFLPDLEA